MFGNILLLGFFKIGNLWFGKRERENHEGICLALISLSSGMGGRCEEIQKERKTDRNKKGKKQRNKQRKKQRKQETKRARHK